MVYTNNVPQASQQIATTQPIIQANFGFLQTGIGVDHNFDATGSGSNMYHNKASMPNMALSPALPASTNGVYFVNSAIPYFYDGTTNYQLNSFQTVLTGSYTPTSSSSYTTIATLPANVQGIIILVNTTKPAGQVGTFLTSGTNCYGFSTRIKLNSGADDYPVELNNNNASLDLVGRSFSSGYNNILYTYKIFYRPA